MVTRARLGLILLTAACLLLLSAIAAARIVPQKGIMGIKLNMTGTRVIHKKGKPDSERVVQNEILGRQRILRYDKTRVGLNGPKRSNKVIAVSTKDPKQRTRSGVGVGSTEAEVKSGVQGIRCRTEAGSRHCFKGKFQPGERVTDFSISLPGHLVTRVTVAIVID